MADLYETLGVSPTATADEIKKAYRALARRHHPDANAGDPAAEERFKEISHAYDVLSDEDKRRRYDQERAMFGAGGAGRFRPGAGGTAAGAGAGGFSGQFGDFADIFSSIFRGGKGRPAGPEAARGDDVEVSVNLSFEQAMAGAQVPVVLERQETCVTCSGSGSKAGSAPKLCPECSGRGVKGRNLGGFAMSGPCETCGGAGTVIEDPCAACHGTGTRAKERKLRVRIPPGVRDGTRIRLKGRGQAGVRGGAAGDLHVVTRVAPSRLYERRGDDLVLEVPVTFAEAALGAKVEIPTLDGRVALTVPAGSQDGRTLRVREKGAPRLSAEGRGDLLARLRVQVPQGLTDRQRKALEEFAKLDGGDVREALFT
ncbi:MAG: molecular chaperone DnaJ [Thermoleophilia bacterium]|jgi:molecular chaperone DnaJ|nr:molecular chaperone DnaJ [Thermoleophilia bacterium]